MHFLPECSLTQTQEKYKLKSSSRHTSMVKFVEFLTYENAKAVHNLEIPVRKVLELEITTYILTTCYHNNDQNVLNDWIIRKIMEMTLGNITNNSN